MSINKAWYDNTFSPINNWQTVKEFLDRGNVPTRTNFPVLNNKSTFTKELNGVATQCV